MLKIFWDKDNIGLVGDRLNAAEHAHCVLQAFLSFDAPLQITVETTQISGKCIVLNQNTKHSFSCSHTACISVLIEPTSGFARELISKMEGKRFLCSQQGDITALQQKAAALAAATDPEPYRTFVRDFADFLGVERKTYVLDDRIAKLLDLLEECDCYNHTIRNLGKQVALSPDRLSHLFRTQIGVPLKSYLLFHQLEKAFTAILNGSNITDAAMLAGFDSPSHFAATVKKWVGMSVSASTKDSEFLKVLTQR